MKLHSNNKSKSKFQFVVNFTKGNNDNDFSGSTYFKKALQHIACKAGIKRALHYPFK